MPCHFAASHRGTAHSRALQSGIPRDAQVQRPRRCWSTARSDAYGCYHQMPTHVARRQRAGLMPKHAVARVSKLKTGSRVRMPERRRRQQRRIGRFFMPEHMRYHGEISRGDRGAQRRCRRHYCLFAEHVTPNDTLIHRVRPTIRWRNPLSATIPRRRLRATAQNRCRCLLMPNDARSYASERTKHTSHIPWPLYATRSAERARRVRFSDSRVFAAADPMPKSEPPLRRQPRRSHQRVHITLMFVATVKLPRKCSRRGVRKQRYSTTLTRRETCLLLSINHATELSAARVYDARRCRAR